MRTAIVIMVAAVSGWLARGLKDVESAPAPAPQPAAVVLHESEPGVALPRVGRLQLPADSRGGRNLFAYDEPPVKPKPEPKPVVQYVPPPVDVIAAAEPVVSAPRPPQFPYRFLGAFGSREVRVAAFSRDGEIVTARAGDRVGDFVVQSIGRETVDVRGPDGSVQRVAIPSAI